MTPGRATFDDATLPPHRLSRQAINRLNSAFLSLVIIVINRRSLYSMIPLFRSKIAYPTLSTLVRATTLRFPTFMVVKSTSKLTLTDG